MKDNFAYVSIIFENNVWAFIGSFFSQSNNTTYINKHIMECQAKKNTFISSTSGIHACKKAGRQAEKGETIFKDRLSCSYNPSQYWETFQVVDQLGLDDMGNNLITEMSCLMLMVMMVTVIVCVPLLWMENNNIRLTD